MKETVATPYEDKKSRLRKQLEVEENLPILYDKKTRERLEAIRLGIFGKIGYRESDKIMGTVICPSVENASQSFEVFCESVDNMVSVLSKQNESDILYKEQVLNLLAFYYTIGMHIHPYEDGNGQSFKIALTSYIHELLPNTDDIFLQSKIEKSEKLTNVISGCDSIPVQTNSELKEYNDALIENSKGADSAALARLDDITRELIQKYSLDFYREESLKLNQEKVHIYLRDVFYMFTLPGNIESFLAGSHLTMQHPESEEIFYNNLEQFKKIFIQGDIFESRYEHTQRIANFLKKTYIL